MKKGLPASAKIAKDSKECVQECISEFLSFVTSEASDKCQREKRKTINGDDLLWAMSTLGFEDYVEPLKVYLAKYREVSGDGGRVSERERGDGEARQGGVEKVGPLSHSLSLFPLHFLPQAEKAALPTKPGVASSSGQADEGE